MSSIARMPLSVAFVSEVFTPSGRCIGPASGTLPGIDNDRATRIAALLHEAGDTYHTVYRIVDGDDPDWASWYADWPTRLSELPQILETTPAGSELTWLLVSLERDYAAAKPETPWPHAERIVSTSLAASDYD
jgi:hypothetical protein